MPDRRGCSPQRPVDRLVTTPQTVQSFTRESSAGWLVRSIRSGCYAWATMAGPLGGLGRSILPGATGRLGRKIIHKPSEATVTAGTI